MKLLSYAALWTVCIVFCFSQTLCAQSKKKPGKQDATMPDSSALTRSRWLRTYDFNAASFKMPSRYHGPLTRWWWPGNDVENAELRREIALFADYGFAGVEIQPFSQGLNFKGPDAQLKRQLSWDSPAFYEHLRAALQAAHDYDMIVDLNAGSGWPMGGPHIKPEESLLTLAYADTIVTGSGKRSVPVPALKQQAFTFREGPMQYKQTVPVTYARLQAVVAAKVRSSDNKQTVLDAASIQTLTAKISNGHVNWDVPVGQWKIIAFWSMPDGELPKVIASETKGLVVDHLDSAKVIASYDYLLGAHAGIGQFYGNPLRSVFNDSYEFMADRHYADHFLSFFKRQRGYDLTPYLPVNMKQSYNSSYIAPFISDQPFDFSYGSEDWRVRYDYDQTINELLINQFIKPSNRWLGKKGLLHRNQAYGIRMDVIGGSGAADIPETEQLAGGNSEGFLKLVSSGAHLYGRPLITQESFVFFGLAEMMTPQKIKLLADKSFAAGVNQIIYHGTPYRYQTGEYGKEGWSPFSNPFNTGINFSSTINESFPFWHDIKRINQYITRCQYVLQAGKPKADVLIYFPFNDLIPEQVAPNPAEILTGGRLDGVDPAVSPASKKDDNEKTKKWFTDLWPVINELEASGISWDFVNDESLQGASYEGGKISVRGNKYASLVLANLPYILLRTAESVYRLSGSGAALVVYGPAPVIQPSFLNFKENDRKTQQLMRLVLKQSNTRQITDHAGIAEWTGKLPLELKLKNPCKFIRTTTRQMNDGSRIKFISNQSDQRKQVLIAADKRYPHIYWLDAATGAIERNTSDSIVNVLPPYGSVFLFASPTALPDSILSNGLVSFDQEKVVAALDKWDVRIGDSLLPSSTLFDWRTREGLKHQSARATYRTTFVLDKKQTGSKYILDLGKVFFTAAVRVNGLAAGECIWAPYQVDVTSWLRPGINQIEVEITPTYRNEFIGEAVKGNAKYAQFRRKEHTLMPAGLVGPVRVVQYLK